MLVWLLIAHTGKHLSSIQECLHRSRISSFFLGVYSLVQKAESLVQGVRNSTDRHGLCSLLHVAGVNWRWCLGAILIVKIHRSASGRTQEVPVTWLVHPHLIWRSLLGRETSFASTEAWTRSSSLLLLVRHWLTDVCRELCGSMLNWCWRKPLLGLDRLVRTLLISGIGLIALDTVAALVLTVVGPRLTVTHRCSLRCLRAPRFETSNRIDNNPYCG